ncbi:MAG: helix-turn-helix transcriptional regulator [Luteimonas sp.]
MSSAFQAVRRFEPLAVDWRRVCWDGGAFDSARRERTERVEGLIRLPSHLLLLTVSGGAEHLDVRADCGHRYRGADRAGAMSFVPAGCTRHLSMTGVRARWASLSLDPALLDDRATSALRALSNLHDPFLHQLLLALELAFRADGDIDRDYAAALTAAAARHVARRCLDRHDHDDGKHMARLSVWRMRRIEGYVEAQLHGPIRIGDLAAVVGLSEGHLHRAFRATTGMTPLAYLQQRRIERATALLTQDPALAILDLALQVGFTSPGHFARTFRRVKGVSPSRYLAG